MKRGLIGSVISDAKHLGELRYRGRQVENQLREITIRSKRETEKLTWKPSRRVLADMARPAVIAVVREHERAVRDHVEYIARTRRLLEEELQEIQRLTSEVEAELSETLERLERA